MRNLAGFNIVVLLLFFAACDFRASEIAMPDYESVVDVKRAEMGIKKGWRSRGRVIIGRLKIPKGVRVATRTSIYRDGSFCSFVYQNRKMAFYVDGYEPLIVSKLTKISEYVYDTGTLSFTRAAPETLRSVKGSVVLGKPEKAPVQCNLNIWNKNYLYRDQGYRGGELKVTASSRELANGQEFQFENLSKIPYTVAFDAPDHITKKIEIRPEQTGVIDLGKIHLIPAKTFQIQYMVRVKQKGKGWIDSGKILESEIICDGRSEFSFSDERDGLRNRLKLRMKPKDDIVVASFFFHKQDSFFEFPASKWDNFPDWLEVDVSGIKGSTESVLRDGPLYFFTVEDINGTDVQLLFRARLK